MQSMPLWGKIVASKFDFMAEFYIVKKNEITVVSRIEVFKKPFSFTQIHGTKPSISFTCLII